MFGISMPLLAVVFGILHGLAPVVFKSIVRKKYTAWAYTLIWASLSTLFFLPLFIRQWDVPALGINRLYLLVVGGGWMLANYCTTQAFKTTDASVVMLVARLSLLLTFFGGLFWFDEAYTSDKVWGLILTMVGSLVVIWEGKKFNFSQGIIFSLLSVFFVAIAELAGKKVLNFTTPFAFGFFSQAIQMLLAMGMKQAIPDAIQIMRRFAKQAFFAMLSFSIAWAGLAVVLQQTEVSRTFIIYDVMILLTGVGLGIIWLKETGRLWQKMTGILLCLGGIILLSG
ncbi:MAG: EamA family transporter [Candidatus Pacebacteria bacterium]|nr:EamA family transporter [Candidatus Paceibacterota bacterium]